MRSRLQIPFIVRNISAILTVILFIKIGGYFSIVEDRTITQIFKVISRIGMTGLIGLLFFRLKQIGCVDHLQHKNVLAPALYIGYLLLGFISFSWSTKPSYSILQWVMAVESFVFVYFYMKTIHLVNHYFPKHFIDMVKVFAWGIFPLMAIFLAGSFIEPDTFYRGMRGGTEQRLGGFMMNPNELGMLAVIAAACCYLVLQKKITIGMLIAFIVSLVVLWLTSSRSSLIGFLAIIGILILKGDNKKVKFFMVLAVGAAVPFILKFVIFKEGGGVEEVMSMTGRLPFWKALLNEGIIKEPWFGYGFMRINYIDTFQGLNTYPGKMTHNTFMQVLMNLGFVGFFLCFWQLAATVSIGLKDKLSPYRNYFIALLIPLLINSFTEFGIFGEANYGIIFYQFLICLFLFESRSILTSREKLYIKKFKNKYGNIV